MARTLTAKDGRRYRATSTPGVVIAGDPPSLDLRVLTAEGEVLLLPGVGLDSSRNTFRRIRDAEAVAKQLAGLQDWPSYSDSKYVRPDADQPGWEDEDGWKPVFVPEFYDLADKVQDAFPRPMSRHARYWMTPCPTHGLEYINANRRCEPPYWAANPDHESNETGANMSDSPQQGDIRGPGVSVTGGSKVGNISRTGPGVTTPTPPPVRTDGRGGGIHVTNGSRTGNIAYGNGAVAGPYSGPSGSAPPTSPSGRRPTWDDSPGGATTPTSGGSGAGAEYAEFGDHARVRRFANEITSLGDGSEFVQIIKACHGLADASRDFGGDMNLRTRAFVDAAIAAATSGDALRDEAAIVAKLSQNMSGDE